MGREEQIEEIANLMADTMAKNFGLRYKDFAEKIYDLGYRKTFTSDLASDTQKAYKEGYGKGIKEREAEMERLKAQLSEFENPVTQFVKDRETQAVKEFAEKLKKRSYCDNNFMDGKWHRYVFVDEIDELLKEYEQ